MKQQMGMGVMKIGAAAAIVLLFGIIHLAAPGFLPELVSLLARGDISDTVVYIRGYGDMAAVFAFFLTLFVNALGFPPGVTIAFLLMRFYFRDAAEKVITKSPFLSKIDRYSGTKGFFVMLIARMIPYIPSALLNAVGALSSIRLRDYVIASFVGKFPSTGIEAIIGHDLIVQQPDNTRLIIVIVCAIGLIAGAWRYEKHVMKAESAAEPKENAS